MRPRLDGRPFVHPHHVPGFVWVYPYYPYYPYYPGLDPYGPGYDPYCDVYSPYYYPRYCYGR